MATFAEGSYVFIPNEDEVFVAAKVSSTFKAGKPGQVKLLNTKRSTKLSGNETQDLVVMDEQSLKSNEDMVQMRRLDNASILHNLRLRFAENLIYTNIGSILVAVNPFQQLPIYGPQIMDDYGKKGARAMPPHIYGVADNAYRSMVGFYKDQSCIVSGESGAGKTETTKLFLQYVAEKSGGADNQREGTPLQEQILEANPIMEAFGNAKTVRNDNSSRFGKWINVSFNNKAGTIVGGSITQYLLEKSRVVQQAEKERNYHVFYQLCAAGRLEPKIKKKFSVMEAEEYHYLNQSKKDPATQVDSIDDAADWEATLQAFNVMGMSEKVQDEVMKVVAAILHLGNVTISGSDKAKVAEDDSLKTAAKQLGTKPEKLQKALTIRTLIVGREKTHADNKLQDAIDARDALAKALYSYMFDWLISQINDSLKRGATSTGSKDTSKIGVLDIFGFESFEHNSFEQLCINFCNEKLQGHFNEHIFKLEQKEYEAEGVDVSKIEFIDNVPIINFLEASRTGVFSMIDEENQLPRGSDDGLLGKVTAKADGKIIKKPDMKSQRGNTSARSTFVVVHYAGEVAYNVIGFLEKNKDALLPDLQAIGLESKNSFIKKLFEIKKKEAEGASSGRGGKQNKKSLGSQFKTQLSKLMETLNATEPHFVRCVKPNAEKVGGEFTAPMVMDQLKYAGLLEVCRIRQLGYPIRKSFSEFHSRYYALAPKVGKKEIKEMCKKLEKKSYLKKDEYQIGKKKVFMRTEMYNTLEAAREKKLGEKAIKIQAFIRGFVQASKYKRFKKIKKDIVNATKDRNESKLEKALLRTTDLPHNGAGVAMKFVADGRKMLATLREERRLIKLLNDAVKLRDESAIKSALAACKDAKCSDKSMKAAEKLLKTIEEEVAAKKDLQDAITSAKQKSLKSAISKAEKLKMNDTQDFKDAKSLLDRLEKVDKVAKELEAANAKKDSKKIKKLMTEMVELGAKDHEAVAAGEKITKEEAKASESRAKEMKKIEEDLKKACDDNDLFKLRELEGKVIEYGMSGKVVDKANKLRKKLEKNQDAGSRLAAVKNTLAIKARSHDGISKDDIKPLKKTIESAVDEGMSSDDEQLVAAKDFLKQMKEQLKVQVQLSEALESKSTKKLKAALQEANALGMETGDAQKVAAEVRERDAEESEKNKEQNAKDREEIRGRLKDATKKDLEQEAFERLKKLSSTTHMKRINDASDNSRFDLAKYYKIRTDEDFTEFDPVSFKKQRATLKLWSRTKPIPKSILELDSDLNKIAVRINRAMLQYCGDLSTSFPATLAHYILVSGLETPTICDEIYIQLCKHVRGNTRKESADRGWLLMCMCTKTFPPTVEFSPYLINYLVNRRAAPGLIGNYARLSLLQLDATLELGPTWFKPNIDEIKCYRKRPPILATIERVDGSKDDFPVTPDLRVTQVLEMCRRAVNIEDDPDRPKWGIYVKDNEQEEQLEPHARLVRFYRKYNPAKLVHVDLFLESWKGNETELFEKLVEKYGPEPTLKDEKEMNEKQKSKTMLSLPVTAAKKAVKRLGFATETRAPPPAPQSPWPLPWWVHLGDVYLRMSNQSKEPKFIFKRRLFVPKKTPEDRWLQRQLQDDFAEGELVINSESTAHEMAALSLALQNKGKLPSQDDVVDLLPLHLGPSWRSKSKSKDIAKSIKNVKLPKSIDSIQEKYIRLGKSSHVYGMCFFAVCRQDSDTEYVCGVDYRGVHILTKQRDEIIRTFSYKTIKKFGSTSEFLWMNVVESSDEKKEKNAFSLVKTSQGMNVILYTLQSWEVYDLLYDYTHLN